MANPAKQASVLCPQCAALPKQRTRKPKCLASRRDLITTCVASTGLISAASPAHSVPGLVRYPATQLNNTYVLLRAGESFADADGISNSNPVNKQSRYAELTTLGKRQILDRISPALEKMINLDSTWIWPSINSSSYATAQILTSTLALGQSRLVPEYSFLDCRGLGAYDGRPMAEVAPLLRDGDASSPRWKPPVGWDGTPNESVNDVMVRTRQVLSITETQYSDESIIFVAPDSTVLSVLQAAILGIDLRAHWKYEYRPAEMRLLQLDAGMVRDDSPRSLNCERPPACL